MSTDLSPPDRLPFSLEPTGAVQVSSLQQVLHDVAVERATQDAIHGRNRTLNSGTWLIIATEELGEVARAVQEETPQRQYDELIQAAAVLIAWAEDVRRQAAGAT